MVNVNFYQQHWKLTRSLEKYLLQANSFQLVGESYKLVLLISTDEFALDAKKALVISAKSLNERRERTVIQELFDFLHSELAAEDFLAISSINVLDTNAPLVRNLATLPKDAITDRDVDIRSMSIGGINLESATLITSSVLSNLVEGTRRAIRTDSDRIIAGVVRRITPNYVVEVDSLDGQHSTLCDFSDIVSVHQYLE